MWSPAQRPGSIPAPGCPPLLLPALKVCSLRSPKIFSLAKLQYPREMCWGRGDPALPLHIKPQLDIIVIIVWDPESC